MRSPDSGCLGKCLLGELSPRPFGTNVAADQLQNVDQTAKQIKDGCQTFLDANDKLIVNRASAQGAWTSFGRAADDWLRKYVV